MKGHSTSKKTSKRFNEIIDASAKVFREKGYKEATLEDIAKEVGMLKGSLYYYIDKKENLLYEVIKRPFKIMNDCLREIVKLDEPASVKLEKALQNHMYAFENYESEIFVWMSVDWFKAEFGGEISALGDEYDKLLRSIIEEGIRQNEFRDDLDPKLITFALFGIYNYIPRWYSPKGTHTLSEIASQFQAFVFQGLAKNSVHSVTTKDEK